MSCSAAALLTYIIPLHNLAERSVFRAQLTADLSRVLLTDRNNHCSNRERLSVWQQRRCILTVILDCVNTHRHKMRDLNFTLWLPAWAPWVRITPMSCQRPHDSRFTLLYHLQKLSFKQIWLQYTHKIDFCSSPPGVSDIDHHIKWTYNTTNK